MFLSSSTRLNELTVLSAFVKSSHLIEASQW